MDLNLVVIAGRLAAEPEIRQFESGSSMMRLLVTVRSGEPRRRIDVIPVVLWNPSPDLVGEEPVRGRSVWVAGSVQRRFWSQDTGRLSRVEIVAHEVAFRDHEADLAEEEPLAS
ncbi:MAG: single-stranded DNA-binding protein [Actinomycetota bacterium]|nr:single-stranded DNA-binding protein [Actinomycetota bacterium]